jgi:hypothetical protein
LKEEAVERERCTSQKFVLTPLGTSKAGAVFEAAGKASATNEGGYRRMECSYASYSYLFLMGVRILRKLRILRVWDNC